MFGPFILVPSMQQWELNFSASGSATEVSLGIVYCGGWVFERYFEFVHWCCLPFRSWGVCFTYGTWFALEAFACMQHRYCDG